MMPNGRRPVRLSARGVLAAVGVSLRLDAVPGHPDRDHRRRGRRLRALSRRAGAGDLADAPGSSRRSISRPSYAVSLSTQQLVGILMVAAADAGSTRAASGSGKLIQNIFTSAKTLSLLALIVLGIVVGRTPASRSPRTSRDLWTPRGAAPIESRYFPFLPALSAANGALGLLVALCVAQVGSLFSADAWNNITFTAGEVKNPRRNVPLSLALGTHPRHRPLHAGQRRLSLRAAARRDPDAPDDRVATAALEAIFGGGGRGDHGGRDHDLDLRLQQRPDPGRRARLLRHGRDGLFFARTGRLNEQRVPAVGLVLQCVWTCAARPAAHARSVDAGDRRGDLRQPLQQPARLRRLRGADLLRADHRWRSSSCAARGPTPSVPTAPSAIRSCRRSTSSPRR